MAVSTIGNDIRPIPVDTLGIGVTPVYGSRSLEDIANVSYVFAVGLEETNGIVSVVPGEIDHDLLLNAGGNQHIDWTAATENFETSGTVTVDNILGATTADTITVGDVDIVGGMIDASFIANLPAQTFAADIVVSLDNGKTLGRYLNGETIPSTGLTAEQVLNLIATDYFYPEFTAFVVSGQSTTVEVGTQITTPKTITWGINPGSGSVSTIDIEEDVNGGGYSVIANDTANDGSESVTVATTSLTTDGMYQRWRGVGTDTTPDPDETFNSSVYTVTARYYSFFGPDSSDPTGPIDSSTLRGTFDYGFQVGSVDTFTFSTGTTETNFYIILPPGVAIDTVLDLSLFNGTDITASFLSQGTITVNDAASSPTSYNLYKATAAVPYSTPHTFQITTT